ncbi:MAG: archaellin/type IV pilin N-terminal domain-containing protein [Candidatus Nitrosotenuis sp.]
MSITSNVKKRRGIAPAITTLILIGVAVAAGLGAYAAYNSASSIATLKGVISVENAQLIKSTNGEEYISVTLKNSGNKHISATTINLQADTNTSVIGMQPFTTTPLPLAMSPGQTSSVYSKISFANGTAMTIHNIGDHIPMEIAATTSDGSTVRTASSVVVSLS